MSALLYYSSASGNTERFISKLALPALRVPVGRQAALPDVDAPYMLVCPSYADARGGGAVPSAVIRALNDESLRRGIRGVIGAGNRNFGKNFACAADVIANRCKVPVLYRFELAGTDRDLHIVRQGLEKFWIRQHSNDH